MNQAKQYFDSVAEGYAQRSEGGLWKFLRRKEIGAVVELLAGHSLGDLLELGSGSGYYSHQLNFGSDTTRASRVVCVDFSSKMLEKIKIPGCEKIEADIQYYQSQDTFDTILCVGVLEFLPQPQMIFANVAKMLRPNGQCVILVPRVSMAGSIYRLFHRRHGIKITLFNPVHVEEWAMRAGLTIMGERQVPLFSLVLKLGLKIQGSK
jgi:SAM-dependent methyltransferase